MIDAAAERVDGVAEVSGQNVTQPMHVTHGEWLIDEGDDESFPASDPSSVTQPHGKPRKGR